MTTTTMIKTSLHLLTIGVLCLASIALAQAPGQLPERSRENLMAVVRESIGGNKSDEILIPMGKAKARLPDGKEIELDFASWSFIGDMHIRLVFDTPTSMTINATPPDLERLGLADVNAALAVAVANLRRVYGDPTAKPWTGGLMQVQGKSPDFDSSYILDRAFWNGLLTAHPEGLVVAVPKRGGLLFTPVSDSKAVEGLRKGIGYLFSSSERLRVSGALYLFREGKWSVFQAPPKQ